MAKKKVDSTRTVEMRELIDPEIEIPVSRQCELLGLPASSFYYKPHPVKTEQLNLMKAIEDIYLEQPYYGSRRIAKALQRDGWQVSRKRVRRMMRIMCIQAIYQRPNTSKASPENKVYPYLLRGMAISRPDQVWCTDITYIRLTTGWSYLMAVMDWHSRRVISWGLSNTMDIDFCVEVLQQALKHGKPEIFNTDQGSQFTSSQFTDVLKCHGIGISMDGRGRYQDNIYIERLWRTVKYENVFINDYQTLGDAREGLDRFFDIYNKKRLHQSLGYKTPQEVWKAVS
jgi:putative transposase